MTVQYPPSNQPPPGRAAGAAAPLRGKGTLLAFVAALVFSGGAWLVRFVQSLFLMNPFEDMPALLAFLDAAVTMTVTPAVILTLTLSAFPYRTGHFAAIAVSALAFLITAGTAVWAALGGFIFVDHLASSVLLIFSTTGAVLAAIAWRGGEERSALRVAAVCLIAAVVVLLPTIVQALLSLQYAPSGPRLSTFLGVIPLLFLGVIDAGAVILASTNRAWARFVAAAALALFMFYSLMRSIGILHGHWYVVGSLVLAMVCLASIVMLILAAIRTGREQNANQRGKPPTASGTPNAWVANPLQPGQR